MTTADPELLARLRALAQASGLPLSDERLRALAPMANTLLTRFGELGTIDLGDTPVAFGLDLTREVQQ